MTNSLVPGEEERVHGGVEDALEDEGTANTSEDEGAVAAQDHAVDRLGKRHNCPEKRKILSELAR
jgi:hypothetical protein